MEPATEEEYQVILGEIALFTWLIENSKIYTYKPGDASKNLTSKNANSTENNTKDKSKIKNSVKTKSPDNEEFQCPRKAERIIKEIPINQVVCTTKNTFAVLEDEQPTVDKSDPPIPSTPKIKPIMMKITKNNNIILQEISRKYSNTSTRRPGIG
ncbi:hypothetical protein TNCT_632031 [Trichonephila clavata]|uniref:Uncharacterized protein n=1 Tax=Trichonephila clavata TaxID=2740835 RepID=A0A8X6HQ94_TRICU|nr:hypothetical protein TNCT_632031 [Trichonephila clavata]